MGININNRAIQTAPSPFNHPRNHKNPRCPREPLQCLPRPIAPKVLPLRTGQFPLHPLIPRSRGRIPQINGRIEVLQELVPAVWCARAHCSAEVTGAWVTAQVGFGEEEEMDVLGGGVFGDAL